MSGISKYYNKSSLSFIMVVIIVVIIGYFIVTKLIPGVQDDATLATLDTSNATISQAQALNIADEIYANLNGIGFGIGGGISNSAVSSIQNELSACQNGADFNLVCQQFGLRSVTLFGISEGAPASMPVLMSQRMNNTDYLATITPFQNTGGLV